MGLFTFPGMDASQFATRCVALLGFGSTVSAQCHPALNHKQVAMEDHELYPSG